MSNTLTTINDSKIMSDGVAALNYGLSPLNVFSLDVSAEIESAEYVYVPLASARTSSAWTDSYEKGDTTIVGKSVQLDTHPYASWQVTEAEQAKTPVNVFEMAAKECGYALAAGIQDAAIVKITASTYGNVENTSKMTVTAANFDVDKLFDLVEICEGARKMNRFGKPLSLVIKSDYISNLMKDPACRDMSASGKDTIVSGYIGRLAGVDIYANNIINANSTVGSGGEYLVGFICQPEALAVAVRPVPTRGGYDVEEIAVDPQSGAAMTYRRWTQLSTGTAYGTFTCLMGVGAVNPAALVRIVSQ